MPNIFSLSDDVLLFEYPCFKEDHVRFYQTLPGIKDELKTFIYDFKRHNILFEMSLLKSLLPPVSHTIESFRTIRFQHIDPSGFLVVDNF